MTMSGRTGWAMAHPCRTLSSTQHTTGLTGFDISFGGRSCDPSCSDSLNGATKRIADKQFALAA